MPTPLAIHGVGKTEIEVTWEDEHRSVFPGKYLRSRCRCAECIEEMTGRKVLDDRNIPDDIRFDHIELIGAYAIAIRFSDQHATGIFSFRNLREWCPCAECASARSPTG